MFVLRKLCLDSEALSLTKCSLPRAFVQRTSKDSVDVSRGINSRTMSNAEHLLNEKLPPHNIGGVKQVPRISRRTCVLYITVVMRHIRGM